MIKPWMVTLTVMFAVGCSEPNSPVEFTPVELKGYRPLAGGEYACSVTQVGQQGEFLCTLEHITGRDHLGVQSDRNGRLHLTLASSVLDGFEYVTVCEQGSRGANVSGGIAGGLTGALVGNVVGGDTGAIIGSTVGSMAGSQGDGNPKCQNVLRKRR